MEYIHITLIRSAYLPRLVAEGSGREAGSGKARRGQRRQGKLSTMTQLSEERESTGEGGGGARELTSPAKGKTRICRANVLDILIVKTIDFNKSSLPICHPAINHNRKLRCFFTSITKKKTEHSLVGPRGTLNTPSSILADFKCTHFANAIPTLQILRPPPHSTHTATVLSPITSMNQECRVLTMNMQKTT